MTGRRRKPGGMGPFIEGCLQQVEHEAYLTLMAERAGILVPDVLAAGRFGPSSDAALGGIEPEIVAAAGVWQEGHQRAAHASERGSAAPRNGEDLQLPDIK